MHLRLTWRHQLKQQRQHLKPGASCGRMLGHATSPGDIKIKKCFVFFFVFCRRNAV